MRALPLLVLANGLAHHVKARTLPHASEALLDTPTITKRLIDFSQNPNTTSFAVNGSAIPDVSFDIGESYAGLIPIDASQPNGSALWFWFFPTENPAGSEEIVIWFNGCSSLEGLLEENGPFLWQPGTFRPVKNPWTWVNLTNVLWVEHGADTGFSRGPFTAKNEEDIAAQFTSWYKNFVDTFGLHGWKIYLTGESFGGYYVPYTTDAMLKQNDTDHYNVQGIMIYDPSTSYDAIQTQVVAVPYVDHFSYLFNLNQTFMADIHARADSCGYTDYFNRYMVFPPAGPLPAPPDVGTGCDLWTDIYDAVSIVNPCFSIYEITTSCPQLWDNLGFPGSRRYLPEGATVYFNRSDVQKAVNAPPTDWSQCANSRLSTDDSLPSGIEVLPRIIERLDRTIIGHGDLDYILIGNGTLLMVQNMTWHGQQGLSAYPDKDLFVPYHSEASEATLAGSGILGKWRTERNVTYIHQFQAGHMIPQFQPAASYRQLEFLLGRIDNLSQRIDFTTQNGDFGNNAQPGSCSV
ncbi:Carboxypeptidase [Pleurostoma richardsiae]|uniref:Carboxypeptidase n=1 Tax=Pleurostoma richardsiae TaxID=41990 RepID=A0AA38VEZ9_9PEZI|nr:Carboxypeptidase [Pleurostoma richardsiae]